MHGSWHVWSILCIPLFKEEGSMKPCLLKSVHAQGFSRFLSIVYRHKGQYIKQLIAVLPQTPKHTLQGDRNYGAIEHLVLGYILGIQATFFPTSLDPWDLSLFVWMVWSPGDSLFNKCCINFYFFRGVCFMILITLFNTYLTAVTKTRRFRPLRGPTYSSCGGLWPSAEGFVIVLWAKKVLLYCFSQF